MSRSGRSILVVDDDVDICKNLSDILTDFGYEVDFAHNGLTALDLVRQKAYDVALLDLKMPGMDGLTLYREIKKLRSGTVALIVTAYATSATAEEAIASGAWQVVSKPVDFSKLMPLIDEALGQPLVLVVDDDVDLCDNLWSILRDRGYRVSLAHTERDVVSLLSHSEFQVVLIDMRLPDGDGTSIFQLVRQVSPASHTVLITGYPAEMNRLIDQVVSEGADAVCYKPFDMPKLLEILQKLVHS